MDLLKKLFTKRKMDAEELEYRLLVLLCIIMFVLAIVCCYSVVNVASYIFLEMM